MHKFVKAAGMKSEKDFYSKYKNADDFFNDYPEYRKGGSFTGTYDLNSGSSYQKGGTINVMQNQALPSDRSVPNSLANVDQMYSNGGGGYSHPIGGSFNYGPEYYSDVPTVLKDGGECPECDKEMEYKKGGWIQKAINPAHKGYYQEGGKTVSQKLQPVVQHNDRGFDIPDPYMKYVDPRLTHELDSLQGTPGQNDLIYRQNDPVRDRINYLQQLQEQQRVNGMKRDRIPIPLQYGGTPQYQMGGTYEVEEDEYNRLKSLGYKFRDV